MSSLDIGRRRGSLLCEPGDDGDGPRRRLRPGPRHARRALHARDGLRRGGGRVRAHGFTAGVHAAAPGRRPGERGREPAQRKTRLIENRQPRWRHGHVARRYGPAPRLGHRRTRAVVLRAHAAVRRRAGGARGRRRGGARGDPRLPRGRVSDSDVDTSARRAARRVRLQGARRASETPQRRAAARHALRGLHPSAQCALRRRRRHPEAHADRRRSSKTRQGGDPRRRRGLGRRRGARRVRQTRPRDGLLTTRRKRVCARRARHRFAGVCAAAVLPRRREEVSLKV
mmetsp:Transcript_20736/g.71229  ORF Transcript_20736/g.71229 Transcript_20736/m.71229 type:complete len:285 (+) Transcript_20736:2-856(+)